MPAHCSLLMAAVPLSVSKSMITSSAGIWKTLKCARRKMSSLCCGVVSLIGSTILILNGSIIVFMLNAVLRHLPLVHGNAQARPFGNRHEAAVDGVKRGDDVVHQSV